MQDLAVEVQTVNTHLVLAFPRCGCDPLVAQHSAEGAHVSGGLVAIVTLGLTVTDTEEVVVRPCDDFTAGPPSRENHCLAE